ncbi:MAG: hypothetical protein JST90_04020 [Bacteroidetes bacterium]|nr:hypothetical protein [Bacteroidota bacterium]
MRLEQDKLYIAPEKITLFLLNTMSESGASKAKLLIHFGFSPDRPEELEAAILQHALVNEVAKTVMFNDKEERYLIEGPLMTPVGRTINLRCVWYRKINQEIIKFVTLYPV